jgi:hypothetical protein
MKRSQPEENRKESKGGRLFTMLLVGALVLVSLFTRRESLTETEATPAQERKFRRLALRGWPDGDVGVELPFERMGGCSKANQLNLRTFHGQF